MARRPYPSVDEYIDAQTPAGQEALHRVRAAIRKALPMAEETISYNIPAYKLDGRAVLYIGGWKRHFSLYPANDELVGEFRADLAGCEISKGTIRFPLDQGVPVKLIERIAKFRAKQAAMRERRKTGEVSSAGSMSKRVR